MSDIFESKWGETKAALTEGLAGNKKKTMDVVLENTKRYLAEQSTAGATSAGNVATLNRVILPVIRRVMPTVIANEIVGVQPMTGPVGQIHTLRIRYADTVSSNTTAGEEALSPFKIAKAYSGNQNNSTPKGASTASLEGTPGKRLSIQILKQPVEAKSRKLSARWTFEAAQDAQAQQGIDVEAEIMAALAQEITAEIDQEIIGSLRTLAGSAAETFDQAAVSGTATFVGDEHAALAVLINRVANQIATRTRRGAGNYAVVSPTALTVLQSATTSAFARSTEGTFEAPTNTKFVGTLNASMRVYVDAYAADGTSVLVGYKGASEADAPAFYCPYIPLMSSGVVLDPSTFEPVVGFLTRYGYVELTNTASSLGNAADYVGLVAGSSLRIRLEDRADKKQISKLDYAVGHNTTHRSPGTHFVWLRHPLDRDISQYNYDMTKGDIKDATFQQHCRNLLGNFTVLWLHKNYLCLNTEEPIETKYKIVRNCLQNRFEKVFSYLHYEDSWNQVADLLKIDREPRLNTNRSSVDYKKYVSKKDLDNNFMKWHETHNNFDYLLYKEFC